MMLKMLRERLEGHHPADHQEIDIKIQTNPPNNPSIIGQFPLPQAAVLVPITNDHVDPQVLLTLRSEQLSSHAGEVSFPGGKQDESDKSLIETALRESYEEVGIPQDQIEVIGRLSALKSKHGLKVTPFVGIMPKNIQLKTNPDELSCAFTVPLRFFAETAPTAARVHEINGVKYKVPSFRYNNFTIWGLTAIVLVDLVNTVFDANISLIEN